jgi:2,4-didehydro-3-deoxy-L-rhamnonate hydrolase
MKIMRLGDIGKEQPAVLAPSADGGEEYFSLLPLTGDVDGAFLAAGGPAKVREALDAGVLPVLEGAAGLRVGVPVARPGAVVGIGMNYAAHAAESGSEPPTVPIIFWKHSNTVVGPYDDVLVPPGATTVDWEVELGVVIGRRARYLSSPEEALDHVAGYVLSHDVSERDFQMKVSGGQWSKGKSCETFNPLGPWLVPADEVDAQNLGLRSWVNGEPRQDSTTADMIFDVAYLVHHLSQYMVLEPGDLINTGTPQGVALSGRFPYLRDGDVVALEIDGLGRAEQRVRDAVR